MRAHRAVQRRRGRGPQHATHRQEPAGGLDGGLGGAARRAEGRAHPVIGAERGLGERAGGELRSGGLALRLPVVRGREVRLALRVEHHREELRRGDAVDHAVVHLGDERPAAAAQVLDHPDLPQRLRAVELLRHDPPHEVAELLVAAGLGQARVPQVVAEVEVGVVDPDRRAERERQEADRLPVARDARQVRPHHPHHRVVGRRRPFQDGHRTDVHMADRVLEVQEGSVLGAEALHRTPPPARFARPPDRSTGAVGA